MATRVQHAVVHQSAQVQVFSIVNVVAAVEPFAVLDPHFH